MSTEVDVTQGRARVVVEATIYGSYETQQIDDLRSAVIRACRAIGSPEAIRLVADVEASR